VGETHVLDSFALLALLGGEPGGDEVARLLREAQDRGARLWMTWVNLGEVAYIAERRWGERRLHQVLATLEATPLEMVPVGRELTLAAAHIKAEHPLAYADAFAAALAGQANATLVTGDPEFHLLEGSIRIRWLPQNEKQCPPAP
jgi:predicted nucleic acid-binding protein